MIRGGVRVSWSRGRPGERRRARLLAGSSDERGSAGGLTLAIVLCLLMMMLVAAWLVSWFGAAHRARSAADLAALAGAAVHEQGADVCQAAQDNAVANGAKLSACSVEEGAGDFIVNVKVQVPLIPNVPGGPQAVQASARAGIVTGS